MQQSGLITASFNPRARDGREIVSAVAYEESLVSIHAPVMDANICLITHANNIFVSIHAPVMDAD